MKGIYLTEQAKQEIQVKIAELEEIKINCVTDYEWNEAIVEQNVYKQILLSAIVLPVEESWKEVGNKIENFVFSESTEGDFHEKHYPFGIIILQLIFSFCQAFRLHQSYSFYKNIAHYRFPLPIFHYQ
jgi:hypothetical protein